MIFLFLSLIFIRPFISSLAFPYLNLIYSVAMFVFLLIWLLLKGVPLKEIQPLRFPLIILAFALMLSFVFSSDRINSFRELCTYAGGFLTFLTCVRLSLQEKKLVIRILVFSAMVICALAIYQYLFGFRNLFNYLDRKNISDPLLGMYLSQKRAFFPFITPGTLAGYLVLLFPLLLTIKDRDRWFTIIIFALALLLTKSMGALLSIFLGMGFYLYLKKDISYRKFAFLGILITLSIVVFALRRASGIEAFLPFSSLSSRIVYWRDTLALIKMYPFAGIGLGNFNLPLSRYAHNVYLQIWAEMGILGIISFLWLMLSVFKISFAHLKESVNKEEIICLTTASFVFLLENFTGFTFFLPEVSMIWWAVLGLAISL